MRARRIERDAGRFQRAQIGDRAASAKASSCASEPPALWMMRAVGGRERARETLLGQRGDMLAEARHQLAIAGSAACRSARVRADCVVAERMSTAPARCRAFFTSAAKCFGGVARFGRRR